jgi:hypothetical protein
MARLTGDVENEDCADCVLEIAGYQAAVSFLASGVPELQPASSGVMGDIFAQKVDADGGLSMNMFLEERDSQGAIVGKRINPKWPEFDKEYTLLLRQEKEINYPDITIDDLKKAGDTKDDYQVLFKLVKK